MQIDSANCPANNLNWSWLLWPTAEQDVSLNRLNLLQERELVEESVVKESLTTGCPATKTPTVYSPKLKDSELCFNFRRKIKLRHRVLKTGTAKLGTAPNVLPASCRQTRAVRQATPGSKNPDRIALRRQVPTNRL